jgi:hypothetical protein
MNELEVTSKIEKIEQKLEDLRIMCEHVPEADPYDQEVEDLMYELNVLKGLEC